MNTHTCRKHYLQPTVSTTSHFFSSASVDGTLQSRASHTRSCRMAHTSSGPQAAFVFLALCSRKHGAAFFSAGGTYEGTSQSINLTGCCPPVFRGGVQSFPLTVLAQNCQVDCCKVGFLTLFPQKNCMRVQNCRVH